MSGQLAPATNYQAFDTNGKFLVGGLLNTYAAGSSTPLATYTDSTLGTPNTNPVVLDAYGRAPVWLDPTKSYKFVLTDASGNPIPDGTTDNIQGVLSGFQSLIPAITNTYNLGSPSFTWANGYFGTAVYVNGAPVPSYPLSAAETAASVTPTDFTYIWGDPRRYGAVGDGATDDTVALNNCLKVSQCVTFPGMAFKYAVSATLNYSVSKGVINGNGSTIVVLNGFTPVANIMTVLSVANANDVRIEKLYFDSTAYAGASSQNWGIVCPGDGRWDNATM